VKNIILATLLGSFIIPAFVFASTVSIVAQQDGYVTQNNATWSTVHDAASGASAVTASGAAQSYYSSGGALYYIARGFFRFDLTTVVPTGSTITAATLQVKGTGTSAASRSYYVVSSTQAGALAVGDFDALGGTAFSDTLTIGTWSASATNTWTLNAAGLAALVPNTVNSLGVRESLYDVANSAPPAGSDGVISWASSATASAKPVLTVTYADAAAAATSTTTTAINQDETLFIFGLFLFLFSVPFWDKVFSITKGSYDV